jgi:uncharacterized repeat protein (TIGR03803 family)
MRKQSHRVAKAVFLAFLFASTLIITRSDAQTFNVLHAFHSGEGAAGPSGQLVVDSEGDLYGIAGGSCSSGECSTAYMMSKSGKLIKVVSFPPAAQAPGGGLLRTTAGSFYGVTLDGGPQTKECGISIGCGTVYEIDKNGRAGRILHTFTGGSDGSTPESLLIEDSENNLYGTTLWGGTAFGVVFKMDQAGNEAVLYTFTGQADGGNPYAGVIQDSASNLYGTTGYGGNTYCGPVEGQGCGTVYKLDPTGKETVLYSFKWGSDGAFPSSGLIQDSAGNLYGETGLGGNEQVYDCDGYEGCGVVYEISADGIFNVLYAFNNSDGFEPSGGLLRDASGTLYGTTFFGGQNGSNCNGGTCGLVFKLDSAGNETVLHTFTGSSDGAFPEGGLVMDSSGNLYGTAEQGGDLNCLPNGQIKGCGVVFEITP